MGSYFLFSLTSFLSFLLSLKREKKKRGRDKITKKLMGELERSGKGGKRKPILKTKSIQNKKETGKSLIIFFILKNTIISEYFYSYEIKMTINDKMLLLFVMVKTEYLQSTKKKDEENTYTK